MCLIISVVCFPVSYSLLLCPLYCITFVTRCLMMHTSHHWVVSQWMALISYQVIFTLLHQNISLQPSTDYVSIGPRFSNSVLQTLKVVVKKKPPHVSLLCNFCNCLYCLFVCLFMLQNRKLLIIGTTNNHGVLQQMGLTEDFDYKAYIPYLDDISQVLTVLKVFIEQCIPQSGKFLSGIISLLKIFERIIFVVYQYPQKYFNNEIESLVV